MIVPMTKVTLLTLAAHREASLGALRDLGVVHVTPLHHAVSGDVEAIRRQVDEARGILDSLVRLANAEPAEPLAEYKSLSPEHLLKAARELTVRMRERAERIQRLNDLIRNLEPLGRFDPQDLEDLVVGGISIRLFKAEPKLKPALAEGAFTVELHRDKTVVYFAVVGDPAWSHPGAVEIPIPDRSLEDLVKERDQAVDEQAADRKSLRDLAVFHPRIEKAAAVEVDHLHWLVTRDGMAQEGPVLLLQGFLPAGDLPRLQAEAKCQGWGWLAEEPADEDAVPTLLRQSKWVRPISLVFEALNILPGYRETDISPIFLAFFSLFFAMLVSDAVYGLIFLALTFLIKWKWKSAPPALVPLVGIMAVSTIIWGVLTGSYLGIENLSAPLDRMVIDKLNDRMTIWNLCFLIGTVHLTLAHLWNIWLLRRDLTALSHLGWIGSCWTMYFLAAAKILRMEPFPYIMPLFGISVFLILVFTIPFKKLKTEFATLLSIPFSIVGNFSDIVSYLRLYLVGFASIVLVKAFNGIAFGDGDVTLMRGIVGAVLIFLIHILNILLSILAVLVHGVRLNALEFSTHMGIQWSGFKFAPFKKNIIETRLQPEEGRPS